MYNKAGETLTKSFETLRLKAYQDSASIWTIAWGHTSDKYFVVKPDSVIVLIQAEDIFRRDIVEAEHILQKEFPGWKTLNENQYAALADFVFNRGTLNWRSGKHTKLFELLCAGKLDEVAEEFLTFTKDVKGHVLKGLLKRRQAERLLFLTPVENSKSFVDELGKLVVDMEPADFDLPHIDLPVSAGPSPDGADEKFEMSFVSELQKPELNL